MKTVITLLLGTVLASACGSIPEPSGVNRVAATTVTATRVARVDLPSYMEVGGIVQPRSTAFTSSRVMATIEEVHVRPGDRVSRGQRLVTLDARELTANAAQAAAAVSAATEATLAAGARAEAFATDLRFAEVTLARIRELHGKQSTTQQELDRALAARDGAAAQARAARAAWAAADASRKATIAADEAAAVASSYAVLSSPFDGVVAERLADAGALAAPGAPLLLLEEAGSPTLDVRLDDSRAPLAAPGNRAEVRLDGTSAAWMPATVVEVGRSDPATHSFVVTLELPDAAAARSGAFGRARFAGESQSTLIVPTASVMRRGQLSFVYLVDPEHHARLRPVVTGATLDGDTEVLAGLRDGDTVVVAPPPALEDGAPVELATGAVAGQP